MIPPARRAIDADGEASRAVLAAHVVVDANERQSLAAAALCVPATVLGRAPMLRAAAEGLPFVLRAEGLEPHKVTEIYLWGTEEPDTFIDISDVFEIKMKAISCHVSQFGDHSGDWDTWVKQRRERAAAMGRRQGMPLAESFRRIEMRR